MRDETLNKVVAIGFALFLIAAAKENWFDKETLIVFGIAVYGSSIFVTVINLFEKVQKLEDRFFNNR